MTVSLGYDVDQGKERNIVRQDPFMILLGYGSFYRPMSSAPAAVRVIRRLFDPFLYSGFNRPYDVDSFTVTPPTSI